MNSEKGTLNRKDWRKVLDDAIWFASLPAIFYITSVLTIIQAQGNILELKDFTPTEATITAIIVYVGNTLLNIIRKYHAGRSA